MRDGGSGMGQTRHLISDEMNAVREPGPVVQPTALLQIVERTTPVQFQTEAILVLRLCQMGVQAHAGSRRQVCGFAHQRRGDTER